MKITLSIELGNKKEDAPASAPIVVDETKLHQLPPASKVVFPHHSPTDAMPRFPSYNPYY